MNYGHIALAIIALFCLTLTIIDLQVGIFFVFLGVIFGLYWQGYQYFSAHNPYVAEFVKNLPTNSLFMPVYFVVVSGIGLAASSDVGYFSRLDFILLMLAVFALFSFWVYVPAAVKSRDAVRQRQGLARDTLQKRLEIFSIVSRRSYTIFITIAAYWLHRAHR